MSKIKDETDVILDRYAKVRTHLNKEFEYISDKELAAVLRSSTSLKAALGKEFDETNIKAIKNKVIVMKNVFNKEFIQKRLRKDVLQKNHPKLNSLLLFMRIIGITDYVPYDVEFFRLLMKTK